MKQSAISDNELIAEFIGLRWESKPDYTGWYKGDTRIASPETLDYHRSWDWLMPVVEKIEITADTILECNDALLRETAKYQLAIPLANISVSSNNKLECVYKAVVEFIKWHNLNK